MSKPFQFSLARLLAAVALFSTGLGSLCFCFRQAAALPLDAYVIVLFVGWASFGATLSVLFRLRAIVAFTILAGIVGYDLAMELLIIAAGSNR